MKGELRAHWATTKWPELSGGLLTKVTWQMASYPKVMK